MSSARRTLRSNFLCRALILGTTFAAFALSSYAGEVDLKAVQVSGTKKSKYGPYIGVFGGVTTGQDGSMQIDYVGRSLAYDLLDADNQFVFGIEVGYQWRTRYYVELGMEFEAMLGNTELQSVYATNGNSDTATSLSDVASARADMTFVAFMVNGTLTLDLKRLQPYIGPFWTRFRPYAGAGVGGAQLWFRNQEVQSVGDVAGFPTAPSASPYNLDQFVFAFQYFGGLEITLTKKVSVYTEYRRLVFERTEELKDFELEMATGGLHFHF